MKRKYSEDGRRSIAIATVLAARTNRYCLCRFWHVKLVALFVSPVPL
jgi:hypothetical protein